MEYNSKKKRGYRYMPIALTPEDSARGLIVFLDFLRIRQIAIGPKEIEVAKTLAYGILSNNLKLEIPARCQPIMDIIISNGAECPGLLVVAKESILHNTFKGHLPSLRELLVA